MGMLIARRLAFMVFVLWGITLVTFFLSRVVPGDAIAGLSLPVFWMALLLQLLFHTELGWLPLGGRLDPEMTPPPHITGLLAVDSLLTGNIAAFVNAAEHLVLPVAVLAAGVY